jgi:hypothetical protein
MSEEVKVVDVVDAARQLLESKGIFWEREAKPGDPLPEVGPQDHPQVPLGEVTAQIPPLTGTAPTCQFGHPNPAGGKFCPECGLKVGVELLDMEAVLRPPKPADELTPEERTQRDMQHQQALAMNAQLAAQESPDFEPSTGEHITIHFVDDGFTFGGHVWLRGQQVSIGPDHPRWEDALKWITKTPDEQINTYRKQYFARGPAPREESAAEQFRQVEVRRALGREIVSDAPDSELYGVK